MDLEFESLVAEAFTPGFSKRTNVLKLLMHIKVETCSLATITQRITNDKVKEPAFSPMETRILASGELILNMEMERYFTAIKDITRVLGQKIKKMVNLSSLTLLELNLQKSGPKMKDKIKP